MEWLAALGGFTSAGLGITIAIMGLRMGRLKADAEHADRARKVAEIALMVGATEFEDYRLRSEFRESQLVEEMRHYENIELESIESDPDPTHRIERRRDWVRSFLSKASPLTGDDSEGGMPEDTTT